MQLRAKYASIGSRKAAQHNVGGRDQGDRSAPDLKPPEVMHEAEGARLDRETRTLICAGWAIRSVEQHNLPGASGRYRLPATEVPGTSVVVQYELPDHFCLSLLAVSGEKILITR